MAKKEIHTVCMPCGQARDHKHKRAMGVWIGNCDICGLEGVPVADAGHDFGIYNDEEHRIRDEATSI